MKNTLRFMFLQVSNTGNVWLWMLLWLRTTVKTNGAGRCLSFNKVLNRPNENIIKDWLQFAHFFFSCWSELSFHVSRRKVSMWTERRQTLRSVLQLIQAFKEIDYSPNCRWRTKCTETMSLSRNFHQTSPLKLISYKTTME